MCCILYVNFHDITTVSFPCIFIFPDICQTNDAYPGWWCTGYLQKSHFTWSDHYCVIFEVSAVVLVRIKYSGVWHHVIGWVVAGVWTEYCAFMFIPCVLNNKCLLYTNICTSGSCLLRITHTTHTHTHTHTHTPNQELRMQPHLPTFYHNNTLLYCILSF